MISPSELSSDMSLNRIAKVVYSSLKAYCETYGDFDRKDWEESSEEEKEFIFKRVDFHLRNLQDGIEFNPRVNYKNWLAEMSEAGWIYGEKTKPQTKEHPNITDYEKLSIHEKIKEYIFFGIVEAFYRCRLLEDY